MPLKPCLFAAACCLASLAITPAAAATQGLVAVRPSKPDARLGAILGPAMGFLECNQDDANVRALCRAVGLKAGAALASAGIRVDARGLVFAYDDGTPRGIDTGHGCSVTAEIKHVHAETRLLADASLDFSGGGGDPALFVAELPVEFAARVDVKQRFGARVLGKCVNIGSDSFKLEGALATTAKMAVLFTLAPAPLRTDAQGNYVFTIRPVTKVAAQLASTDVKFNISGVSFLNGLVTAILGGTSSLVKAVTSILQGDGLGAVWKQVRQHVLDVAVGGALTLPFDLLDGLLELMARAYVEERQGAAIAAYSGEMEKKLRAAVARALKLDANGERSFVVRKEVVDLVRQFGGGADIWLPDRPAGFCSADGECSDGKFCNGVEKCVSNKCVPGSKPCLGGGETCMESSKRCLPTCGGRSGRVCPRLWQASELE
ncbi:hypothetical protein GGTG_10887 [Gaeumannomyces tritici R3-111a-1]|uniref:Uncharacterized protein n=1 Tax=Gaeumannomyces tritici (strain R3-111a-1) TaxID=644352 RepID=J3PBL5_GAET3|nr:hypothetical protein GGTG_10887 [Gaeumannomyces tritici R3-111a-1]EJT71632.1 hypothetical protein GGTG_10887 [Gaeumannomyces tritici R3-111a-1]